MLLPGNAGRSHAVGDPATAKNVLVRISAYARATQYSVLSWRMVLPDRRRHLQHVQHLPPASYQLPMHRLVLT
eukprot:936754-Rhodomonas_salina.12